jgi:outer membrane protein assembly factor BamB
VTSPATRPATRQATGPFNRALAIAGLAAAALAVSACAVPVKPSSASMRGGDPAMVRAALERAAGGRSGPVNALGKPIAFLVVSRSDAGGAVELWAFDLESRTVRWRQSADVGTRVVVARPTIVHADRAGTLVARDIATGAIKWRKPLDRAFTLVGQAAGGDTVAEVVQTAGGSSAGARRAAVIAYDAGSGSRRWTRDVDGPVGAPVVWRDLVVVPRQSQWVTLLDGRNGKVLADILSREQAATFVRGLPEGLFFGSRGVFMASERTAVAERAKAGEGGYLEAKVPEFVRPLYHQDLYRPAENDYSAIDRNRLLWRVQPTGVSAHFTDGAVVVHNFRFFFSLDADSGALRWAYNQPRTDAVASDHTGASIVLVSSEGTVKALDAGTGRPSYEVALPGAGTISVTGATFDADGFSGGGGAGPESSLAATLSSIVWDPDKRFSDVRLFALEQLTKLSGPDVTRELLRALDSTDIVATPVLRKAMDVLVARKDRSLLPVFMEALKVHPDYAEDRTPKRLEFYARAVTELKAKEAIPLLVEHLRLPDTDMEAVREIAEAALALGSKDSLEPFEDFLVQYRADPAFLAHPTPLTAAADVLLRLGGPKERAQLLFIAEHPQTLEALATHIRRSLAQPAPGEKPDPAAAPVKGAAN